jgi:hypothetical protein
MISLIVLIVLSALLIIYCDPWNDIYTVIKLLFFCVSLDVLIYIFFFKLRKGNKRHWALTLSISLGFCSWVLLSLVFLWIWSKLEIPFLTMVSNYYQVLLYLCLIIASICGAIVSWLFYKYFLGRWKLK